MFSRFTDGHCPNCLLGDIQQDMLLNQDDFWECPLCNIQAHSASSGMLAILRKRGKGKFNDRETKASDQVVGWVLTKDAGSAELRADSHGFDSEESLRLYIQQELVTRGRRVKSIPSEAGENKAVALKFVIGGVSSSIRALTVKRNIYISLTFGRELLDEVLNRFGKTGWNQFYDRLDNYLSYNICPSPEIADKAKLHQPIYIDVDFSGESFKGLDLSPDYSRKLTCT